MRKIDALRAIRTKRELALILGVKATFLTHVLYVVKPSSQYSSFTIPKKSGGTRTIFAPSERLRSLQSSLSELLQDCIEEINKAKDADGDFQPTLSHGFVRNRSIITNAMMHLHQKNVLNVDLKDFFDSFNFGRVRGFFIKNKNFLLDPHIATVLAQIACYDNRLPQGSPCSPVITNLITHPLDIRLASLAKANSCTYSRYADDITFSTREKTFPARIMAEVGGEYIPGKRLKNQIRRAGFGLNEKKTRIQYKDSRQDVTGLVVNQKPNVKNEYWRTVKSQCNSLFKSGIFTKKVNGILVEGNIFELEGQLNFIDQVDYYNRLRQKPALNPEYALAKHGQSTHELLSGRERTFSRFLYYRLFYANQQPTILCEGKTDNVYLKSAISRLVASYPKLAKPKSATGPYKLLVSFLNYTARTRFLLQLFGGASYLQSFISEFDDHFKFYKAPAPSNPVIVVLDNDSGCGKICSHLIGKTPAQPHPPSLAIADVRKADFVHVMHNLYVVFTPLSTSGKDAAIEDLFTKDTLSETLSGKKFNPKNDMNPATEYGKEFFAKKVVLAKKSSIDFSGFHVLLARIAKCIEHYESIK